MLLIQPSLPDSCNAEFASQRCNVGLFSAVPPGRRKPFRFRSRQTFLMVTILSCNRPLASPEFFSLAKFRAEGQKLPLRFR